MAARRSPTSTSPCPTCRGPAQVIPDELITPLETAGRQGNSSLFVNGIDPGEITEEYTRAAPRRCASRCLAWSPVLQLSSSSTATGGHVPGLVATAMRVVNAIPGVVAAQPGIRSLLDTPLVTGKGLYASTIR
jgi:hypothetical protein